MPGEAAGHPSLGAGELLPCSTGTPCCTLHSKVLFTLDSFRRPLLTKSVVLDEDSQTLISIWGWGGPTHRDSHIRRCMSVNQWVMSWGLGCCWSLVRVGKQCLMSATVPVDVYRESLGKTGAACSCHSMKGCLPRQQMFASCRLSLLICPCSLC